MFNLIKALPLHLLNLPLQLNGKFLHIRFLEAYHQVPLGVTRSSQSIDTISLTLPSIVYSEKS